MVAVLYNRSVERIRNLKVYCKIFFFFPFLFLCEPKLGFSMRNGAIIAPKLITNLKFILLHASTRNRIGRTKKLFSSVFVVLDIRRIINILRIIALKLFSSVFVVMDIRRIINILRIIALNLPHV